MVASKEDVMEVLVRVYDPEIPINVVDLGLIYDVRVEEGRVEVDMTMTTPACPLRSLMTREVEERVRDMDGVDEVLVKLVWDPPWSPERISEDARRRLGFTG
jgi:FeS assembly SUF system protein